MSGVSLTGVTMTFPDSFTALSQIDLDVADGEFVALIGPSGSGKTTLLRTVAGFLTPTEGSISIGGSEVARAGHALPPEARKLGMVFQQHAIWPHMSVGGNVAYPLRIARRPRDAIEARVDQVLELVGLSGFASRNPATLSGGQRQRVALARALAPDPKVLLLDEALSALDEPLRDQLRVELRSLARRMGLTVIHVTHDRDEALALADRVALLDAGRIVQFAPPAELLHNPATAFVARFMADATLLPGRLDDTGFRATDHPLHLARDLVTAKGRAGAGQLAVLPSDIELSDDGRGDAEVTSSLFGRTSCDVVADWAGVLIRSESDWRPEVGARVQPVIKRGIFYPEQSA